MASSQASKTSVDSLTVLARMKGVVMANNTSRFFEGLVVGGLFGFVIGLLAAPKSGTELRRQLADGSEDLYKHASDSIEDIKSTAGSRITEMKDKTEHAITDLKDKGEGVIKKAGDSVQQTKEQVANKLQEMAGQSTKVLVDDVESATSGN